MGKCPLCLFTLDEVSVFVDVRPRCPTCLLGELEPRLERPLDGRHTPLPGGQVALHLGHLRVHEPGGVKEGREASQLACMHFS